MIDVSKNCNALTYSEIDEELVKWLISDCGARPVGIASVKVRLIQFVST